MDLASIRSQMVQVDEYLDHPSFRWGTCEGFMNYTFGVRDGPCISVQYGLLHEVAHVTQLQPKDLYRVNQMGLGFKVPKTKESLLKLSCTHREVEVWGIQARIIEDVFGTKVNIRFLTGLYVFLPDQAYIPGKNPSEYIVHKAEEYRSLWPTTRVQETFRNNLTAIYDLRSRGL